MNKQMHTVISWRSNLIRNWPSYWHIGTDTTIGCVDDFTCILHMMKSYIYKKIRKEHQVQMSLRGFNLTYFMIIEYVQFNTHENKLNTWLPITNSNKNLITYKVYSLLYCSYVSNIKHVIVILNPWQHL